jgi:rsbT co-antagonist protein RsbR
VDGGGADGAGGEGAHAAAITIKTTEVATSARMRPRELSSSMRVRDARDDAARGTLAIASERRVDVTNTQKDGAQAAMETELLALRQKVDDLTRSEAELKTYLAAMNDVVVVTDWEGRYLKIAPTNPELLIKPGDELIGKTFYEVFDKDLADQLLSDVRCALETKQPMTIEYALPIGGQQRWFLGSITPMPEGRALFIGRDNTQRKHIEQALRGRLEEVIRTQAAALAELSTPLIPISDDIVVMPLIGVLDSQRVQQVMSTLLAGISERRAHVAILDITGVSVVDTQVANALIRAARAAKLLGATVVLTGIRPEVSRTLVGIGVDLEDIATRGTLQSAISHAMSLREEATGGGFERRPREDGERGERDERD